MSDIAFALLGHPASHEHLRQLAQTSNVFDALPGNKLALTRLLEVTPARAAKEDLVVPLPDGSSLRGKLILCSFLPEQVNSPRGLAAAAKTVREACKLAHDLGAKIAGLGGFTSIVGGAQGELLAREFGLAVTSGNSLTAALALAQLESLLERLGWSLADRSAAIVGATGDIGRACALALAPRVKRLRLIARNQSKLETLRGQLGRPNVETGADACAADIIITATSAGQTILSEAGLRPGAVVCDISYPHSVALAPSPRPDVIIFEGGLAEAPFALNAGHYTGLPAPRLLHGCFSETIVLAMAGRFESYSAGQGNITLEQMQIILELAKSHGFRPAPLYRGGSPIAAETLEQFRQFGG
jgi:predicted amino acid dehydrogenase